MIENGIEMRGSLTLASTSGADIQIEDYTDLGYSAATKLGVAVQGGSDDVVGGSMSVGSQASAEAADSHRLGPERGLTGPGGPGCAPEPSRGGGEQPDPQRAPTCRPRGRRFSTPTTRRETALTKSRVVQQAATAMLAQANQTSQMVLALLQ